MSTPSDIPTPPPYTPPYTPPFTAPKQLTRLTEGKMVAGVCAGLGHYLGIDPTLVRVAAVVGLVMAFPAAVIAYVVAWLIVPAAA
ncbi:MAG: PspC domain-containing protein [Marmoricola sp.]